MSDLYDSLEEGSDGKHSSDSLDQFKAQASDLSKAACKSKSMHHYPFYLNQNLTKDNLASFPYFSAAFNNNSNNCREKNFLPKIKNKLKTAKDQEPVQQIVVDNQILNKQGLQLNNDGSFTKSPRPETEDLPFYSREHRDLQFIRQKINNANKKAPAKNQNKNVFSFTDKPVDGISMYTIISARKEKESSEEILVSESSVSSSRSKANKNAIKEQNLTDSMKEKLLHRTPRDSAVNVKGIVNLKNVKRETNILDRIPQSLKTPSLKNGGNDSPNLLPRERFQGNFNSNAGNEVGPKPKSVERKVSRYRSEFAVVPNKPRLNYSERRQLQIGYNPLYLRMGCFANKKDPADTCRSNFGDSMADGLSGFSSRIQSVENLVDEDEEMYYRKLIEMDRSQQRRIARSSRSEGPVEYINLKDVGPNAFKKEKKPNEVRLSGKGSPKHKQASKSMSVDMPYKVEQPNKFFKKNSSHLCLSGSSMTVSKAELALKAKTYGYMVNARNLFKLRAKADVKTFSVKSSGRSGKSKSGKTHPQPSPFLAFSPNKEKVKKRISLPENILPKMKKEFCGGLSETSSKKKSSPTGAKPAETIKENRRHFVLPEVRNLSSRGVKVKTEMLQGISSCLKSPKR